MIVEDEEIPLGSVATNETGPRGGGAGFRANSVFVPNGSLRSKFPRRAAIEDDNPPPVSTFDARAEEGNGEEAAGIAGADVVPSSQAGGPDLDEFLLRATTPDPAFATTPVG